MEAMEPKPPYLLLAVTLLVGAALGFFAGDQWGIARTETKLVPALESAFPKPPEVLTSLAGTVKAKYGASLVLLVDDPDDYFPHLDGTPRAQEERTANVSANTTYTLADFSRLDRNGNPTRVGLSFGDVQAGDMVVVTSAENIRDAKIFEAMAIEKTKY